MAVAPPPHRRPGFSRRAQYGLFAAYLMAVAGIVVALLLLVVSTVDPRGFAWMRSGAAELTAPVARAVDIGRRGIWAAIDGAAAYIDAGAKNAMLTHEVAADRAALLHARAIEAENIRLKAMLGLLRQTPTQVAVGRLLTATGSSARRIATLSVGIDHGVRSGMPVRSPEGLIGQVIEAGPTTARVLLITDADNVVPVRRLGDELPAFTSGLADGRLIVKPVTFGINPFHVGDIIVASGSGGVYYPGTPVGRIVARSTDGGIAQPFAPPDAADVVMVERPFEAAAAAAVRMPVAGQGTPALPAHGGKQR